jgi:hypothetical protein
MVVDGREEALVQIQGVLDHMTRVDGKDAVKGVHREGTIGEVLVEPSSKGPRARGL